MPEQATRRSRFTVVETVVLAIVVVLLIASVVFSGRGSLKAAKRAQAANMANQLQTAVLNYYTEYSRYPVPEADDGKDTYFADDDATAWAPVIFALCGNINPAHPEQKPKSKGLVPNERDIAFLSLRLTDVDSDMGVPKLPFPDQDGNARYFFMAIDSNYDGKVGDKDQAAGKVPDFTHNKLTGAVLSVGVAVWANCNENPRDAQKMMFWVHAEGKDSN